MGSKRHPAAVTRLRPRPPDASRFRSSTLALKMRDQDTTPVSSPVFSVEGVSAQHVAVPPGTEYGFEWAGRSHFMAFHDLQMRDGETYADGLPTVSIQDARATFTFIPSGCRVWGWTAPTWDQNSFLAVYFDPAHLREQLGSRLSDDILQPKVFFTAPELVSTVGKLRRALSEDQSVDQMYVESLCAILAMEFCRFREGRAAAPDASARIGRATVTRIDEYIREHLGAQISLDQLARLAGLSRFHFLRAFKSSAGETPYQRVLRLRIERAQELLTHGTSTVAEVARRVGFKHPSRFIEAFRSTVGVTPGQHAATLGIAPRRRGRRAPVESSGSK